MDLVIKAGRAAMRHVERILGKHSLTFPQFEVLTAAAAGEYRTIGHIADGIGYSRPNLSTIADRLVRHGLIQRVRGADDHREVTIVLTDEGLKVYTSARKAVAPYLNQKVDDAVAGYLAAVILKAQEAAEAAMGQ